MKIKDHVYDEDTKTATVWFEEIELLELKQLLDSLRNDRENERSSSSQAMLEALE